MTISTVLSVIAIVISLAGALYAIAYWRGKVDNDLKWMHEQLQECVDAKGRLIKLETKFEVVWISFAEQILTERTHLATKSSPLKLTDHARKAMEEVKGCISAVNGHLLSDQVLIDIPHQLGMVKLRQIAEDNNMTLGELFAVISLDLNPPEEDCSKTPDPD